MKLKMIGQRAKDAARVLGNAGENTKNAALEKMAAALIQNTEKILAANENDLKNAEKKGISGAMVDRLCLTEDRVRGMADGILEVRDLEDPVGEVLSMHRRPNGLTIGKKRVPMGVIAIIYEARPNVTADAAALCLKTSNAVILRGGSEAILSNTEIVNVLRAAIEDAGLPADSVILVEDTSREVAAELMRLKGYVDVLIPRGGAGLIQNVVKNATVPVIETGSGNCHVYIDDDSDIKTAVDIVVNSKTQRPGVCNAAETLLVSKKAAERFLPAVEAALTAAGVELRACGAAAQYLKRFVPATEEDFDTEFLDLILAVKVVDGIDEAIEHINLHSTGHSEAIFTSSYKNSQRFLQEVDSAAVYVNASTRFTDGAEFGFGAEIGISTQKLHARGPMGLRELTSTKYIIYGDGQIR